MTNSIRWRKSSFSGGGANECIECAGFGRTHAIRDSKNPAGPALALGPTAWQAFLASAKTPG